MHFGTSSALSILNCMMFMKLSEDDTVAGALGEEERAGPCSGWVACRPRWLNLSSARYLGAARCRVQRRMRHTDTEISIFCICRTLTSSERAMSALSDRISSVVSSSGRRVVEIHLAISETWFFSDSHVARRALDSLLAISWHTLDPRTEFAQLGMGTWRRAIWPRHAKNREAHRGAP